MEGGELANGPSRRKMPSHISKILNYRSAAVTFRVPEPLKQHVGVK